MIDLVICPKSAVWISSEDATKIKEVMEVAAGILGNNITLTGFHISTELAGENIFFNNVNETEEISESNI